jgi:hypothetical protein
MCVIVQIGIVTLVPRNVRHLVEEYTADVVPALVAIDVSDYVR